MDTIAGALFFPLVYVAPLYAAGGALPRDHPATIRRRAAACAATCLALAWLPTHARLAAGAAGGGGGAAAAAARLLPALGVRRGGLAAAVALPLALVAALYAGPLAALAAGGRAAAAAFWRGRAPSAGVAARNLVAAPLTEEFLFRACLCSFLLLGGARPAAVVLGSPLLFGAAHLHHYWELTRKRGVPPAAAARAVAFQAAYTTAFGVLAAYLLLRTGHLAAPVAAHAAANLLGLPDVAAAAAHPRRAALAAAYAAGAAAFAAALAPATEPRLYGLRGGGRWGLVEVLAAAGGGGEL